MKDRSEISEASTRVAFTGGHLDRQMEKRSDEAALSARENAASRWLAFAQGKLLLNTDASNAPRALLSVNELAQFEPDFSEAILLGHDGAIPVCAVPVGCDPEMVAAPFQVLDVRTVYQQGLLSRQTLSTIAQGSAMLTWHRNHRFCGRCGARTDMRSGGAKRICDGCQAEHFPRTDPVVIMLTVRGEFCLLARGAHFPDHMISCLAGFMEPGESMEEAVRRETLEEAGIETGRVTYHASQPWPFPYSLMIGCIAEAVSEQIKLDESELAFGRWFSRTEVREMLIGEHPEGWQLPPPGAIATLLIADWAEG